MFFHKFVQKWCNRSNGVKFYSYFATLLVNLLFSMLCHGDVRERSIKNHGTCLQIYCRHTEIVKHNHYFSWNPTSFIFFIKTTIFIIPLIEKNFYISNFIFAISLLFCSINLWISKTYGGTLQEKFCKIGGLLFLAGSFFLRKILKIVRALSRVTLNYCFCVSLLRLHSDSSVDNLMDNYWFINL